MGLSFMVSRVKSLKVIGRKKVQFHLDDLVLLQQQVDSRFLWFCRLAEANPHEYGTGVSCAAHGFNFNTQQDAEEAALGHLTNVHRATGGERRPAGRGKERREREIQRWNSRRLIQ